MKKNLFLILSLLVLLSLALTACGKANVPVNEPATEPAVNEPAATEPAATEPAATEPAATEPAAEEPVTVEIAGQTIEALPEKVKLTFSTVGASVHALPLWVAREKGWLDQLNIELEHISFDNGPIQMEALGADSWDFGTTGQGGVFTGVLKYDTPVLADLVSDDDMMRIWVRADNPIALSGENPDLPGIYGTAEDWKGLELMTPAGTIIHYVAVKTLEKLGLTEDDITLANMSAANAFTALTAGQGEAAGLMGSFTYRIDDDPNYVDISSSNAIGGGLAIAMLVVNPSDLDDPVKMDAIVKALDVHFAVVDWLKSLPIEDVTDWQTAMSEEKGLSTDYDELYKYMNGTNIYDFDYSYNLQTTVSDDGKLTLVAREIIDPLKFFVALDKFTDDDVAKMSSGFFPSEYIEMVNDVRE
jgi:ABC-type nitrate/sulfonate/bicarbonate transport system substrate-binding protein